MMAFKSYSEFIKYHSDLGCKRVQDVYDVNVGDKIATWNLDDASYKTGKVLSVLYLSKVLDVIFIGRGSSYSIDPKDYTIFRLPKESVPDRLCVCGAKHTSFKNHHLSYCPLYKRNAR